MAYIGNGRTLMVLGSNVTDIINPAWLSGTTQGPANKTTFTLSQEVPGGYESNIYVFRQKYIVEKLIDQSSLPSGSRNINISSRPQDSINFTITTSNSSVAAALSDIKESAKLYSDSPADHRLIISGATNQKNNGTFNIVSCNYDGSTITITLAGKPEDTVTSIPEEIGSPIIISRGYSGFWEVLQPEADYSIGGTLSNLNKLITFSKAPDFNDKIYVIHKGDATYNLVPSDNSVGPNQLTSNLRNFVKDTFTGNNSTVTYTLTQDAINDKAILVTINGVVQEGEAYDESTGVVSSNADYALRTSVSPNTIKFRVTPTNGAKIRVLHLGFSTVSRRAVLSPGQVGTVDDFSITTNKLANQAVTSAKIAIDTIQTTNLSNNSITSDKILLSNNTPLRTFQSDGTTITSLLLMNSSNESILNSIGTTSLTFNGTKALNINSTSVQPETTATVSLGTTSKKFLDSHFSGTVNSNSISATNINSSGTSALTTVTASQITTTGNITVGGNLTVTGNVINDILSGFIPMGTIIPYAGSVSSATLIQNYWMLCDGSSLNRVGEYSQLYSILGLTYTPQSEQSGTTFRLPDLRRRAPIGKGNNDTLGTTEGENDHSLRTLTHVHSVPGHTHDLASHTHKIPGHHHSMDIGIGSDLKILSSGTHVTTINIGHSHTAESGSYSGGVTGPATPTITINDTGHSHGVDNKTTTPDISLDHTHKIEVTGQGLHSHTIGARREDSLPETPTLNFGTSSLLARTNSGGTQASVSTNVGEDSGAFTIDGSHTHGASILGELLGNAGTAFARSTSNIENPSSINLHRHTISSATTGISLTQSAHNHTLPSHNHTILVNALPTTNRTDNSGVHTHSSSSFDGRIGKVTGGSNGNSDFNSGPPEPNLTGTSTNFNTLSTTNVPYLLINYLIKVK